MLCRGPSGLRFNYSCNPSTPSLCALPYGRLFHLIFNIFRWNVEFWREVSMLCFAIWDGAETGGLWEGGICKRNKKRHTKGRNAWKIPGYLARARARARPALVKRGASGPCPKKCFKIFPHRARVHGMCIFSWISFFYFISIFNICSVVCMPFDFFLWVPGPLSFIEVFFSF